MGLGADVLKNMTLESTVVQMQAGSSDWLAVDVSMLESSLFSLSQCLGLMILKTSMSMRTEVQESQECADLAGPARLDCLPWHCFAPALRLQVQWGLDHSFSSRLVLQHTSRMLLESEELSWKHQQVADETGRKIKAT